MTWTPRWSVRWRSGSFRGQRQPRWWRLVCLECGWLTADVDRFVGPASRSKAVTASMDDHLAAH